MMKIIGVLIIRQINSVSLENKLKLIEEVKNLDIQDLEKVYLLVCGKGKSIMPKCLCGYWKWKIGYKNWFTWWWFFLQFVKVNLHRYSTDCNLAKEKKGVTN